MANLLDLVALVAAVNGAALVAFHYQRLPARVPMHFGFTGRPDGWGPRWTIWLVPIIAVVSYFAVSVAGRLDGIHPPGRMMLAVVNAETQLLCLAVVRSQLAVALGRAHRLLPEFWVATAVMLLTIPFYGMIR